MKYAIMTIYQTAEGAHQEQRRVQSSKGICGTFLRWTTRLLLVGYADNVTALMAAHYVALAQLKLNQQYIWSMIGWSATALNLHSTRSRLIWYNNFVQSKNWGSHCQACCQGPGFYGGQQVELLGPDLKDWTRPLRGSPLSISSTLRSRFQKQ